MAKLDNRLLDADCQDKIEENFNRVLALIDAISGDSGSLSALEARVTALDNEETGAVPALDTRVTTLEQEAGGSGT